MIKVRNPLKIAVVNSSPDVYNLAVHRIFNYHEARGDSVTIAQGNALFLPEVWDADKIYFSVIFTWDLPSMVDNVNLFKQRGKEIEIGGPAATAMADFVQGKTSVVPAFGLDGRFESVMGNDYEAVFTSRGCPRGCSFCIVQKVEGRKMIEYDDFPIPVGVNPWICDNNILATSWEHQQLVIKKLKDVKNLDINSGFDCRIFVRDMDRYYDLYSQLHLERWRFAYDKEEEREPLQKCADYLHNKGVRYSAISVFCLVGDTDQGDTFEQARKRLQFLVDIDVSPYPMRYRPLDSLVRDFTPKGWNDTDMNALFGYYGVPQYWRTCKWEDFHKSFKNEAKQQKERLAI